MFPRRAIPLILFALLLFPFALAACGDDEEDSGDSARKEQQAPATTTETTTTETTPTTGGTETSADDPASNPAAKELVACLKDQKFTVFTNAGTQVEADYQLVIDAGSGGVLYGFAEAAAAKSAKGKVDENEKSAGRQSEVIGDTVFAFFPSSHSLAKPVKYKKVRTCAGAG